MSKKMVKRSLALGALMAFVITGSAMSVAEAAYIQGEGDLITVTSSSSSGDRVVGGWNTVPTGANALTNIEGNVTVKGGEFNAVVGGHWAPNAHTMTVSKTTVTVEGENTKIKQFVGGTAFSSETDSSESNNIAGRTTTVKIVNGQFGLSGASDTDAPEEFVMGGDLLKSFTGVYNKATSNTILSTIDETDVTISGGKFDAAVLGGTSAIRNYAAYGGGEIVGIVKEANITITGGEFREAIVAGGLAWGHETDSIVEKANLNISNATVTGDIYAGGLDGSLGAGFDTAIAKVSEKTIINISNATVNNVFGTNGNIEVDSGYNFTYKQNTDDDAIVNTDLTLTNVKANIVDLPEGTLTLAGTNNVNNITIGADVTSVTIASKALDNGYSLTGDGTGKLLVEGENTTLTISGITTGTYNIAGGYETNQADKLKFDQKDELLDVKATLKDGNYTLEVSKKSGDQIANDFGVSENTGNFVENIMADGNDEATQFLDTLMQNANGSKDVVKDTLAAVQKMGEAGGNSATAASIVKNVTGVTNDRLSFNCGHSAPQKGGHGVGLFEEGSGADIWVEYVHGKDEVEDMPSTAGASSYEGQYNGLVMGVDFKKVGKFQSGIAFNYGEGDTNSVGSAVRTHSDYDFWGVGYYGNIHNDDSNIIFDINYAQTESDVTQSGAAGTLEASPETTTWTAGVKVEKLYQNDNVQIVPYTGLRYMSIDSDDYATKGGGFMYNMERQNIWMLPVGVSIKQEVTNDNGWTVSPRVDLSYIWAFGDTNSNMEVKVGNGITPIGYDVMDDGSFLGLVGIEAHKGQWGYGIAYSYQKGDHSESKKWYVDVNYSF